jgi:DNA-binding CsgD family transcriptional regulator
MLIIASPETDVKECKSIVYNFEAMPNPELNELSDRELDILKLVATGASNKEIAQKLYISSNTVKVHLRNIFAKIGVASRTEAAMYAVHSGLVGSATTPLTMINGLANDDNSELIVNETELSSTGNFLSKIYTNKIFIIGLFGAIIISVILGIIFSQRNIVTSNILNTPTPTQRVQWIELSGLPTPRRGLAVANYENRIYAIGGENAEGISNNVESYDPRTNIWSKLTSKPTPVTDINAAVLGGLIYIPGGRLSSGKPTKITEIYDPLTNNWSSGAPLPKPLSAYALTTFEGKIYIFGGWDGDKVINDAYSYDPHNNSWSELPPMPTARSNAGAVDVGSKIYVIGGWDGIQALSVNEEYLPDLTGTSPKWVKAIPLPSGRYAMGITTLADIIFIIGGIGSDASPTAIALSPGDNNWGQIETPIQNNWSYLGAVSVGTRLYALGGETETGLSTNMWSYQAIFTITLPIIR